MRPWPGRTCSAADLDLSGDAIPPRSGRLPRSGHGSSTSKHVSSRRSRAFSPARRARRCATGPRRRSAPSRRPASSARPPATFAPQAPLTQAALADAVRTTDALQHPPHAAPPPPSPVTILSTVGAGAVVGGDGAARDPGPGPSRRPRRLRRRRHRGRHGARCALRARARHDARSQTAASARGQRRLRRRRLRDRRLADHRRECAGCRHDGADCARRAADRQVVGCRAPATAASAQPATPARALPRCFPHAPGVGQAARRCARRLPRARRRRPRDPGTLQRAGLHPPPNTGTEAVARMLELRLNHPAAQDDLELLPCQAATRAEAAFSFAQLLQLTDSTVAGVQQAADAFTLPELTPWQRRILTTAVHYVGYPYVWGGTSPTAETLFGVHSAGGFDCSGFVWRVYKLTQYAGEARARRRAARPDDLPDERRGAAQRSDPGGEAPTRRRDVLRRARPALEPERGRPHRALPRQRLVHPVERRGRDAAPVRRLVRDELRLGAPAAARSRAAG